MASSPTTCVVLAGGFGTRLRQAVPGLPKCLAPVGGRSFLELQLSALARRGVDDIVLSLGHLADIVLAALDTMSPPVSARFIVESVPLGTGGAVAHVLDALGIDEALVTNGDTFLDADLGPVMEPLDRANGEMMRLATVTVDQRGRFGSVETDARGFVTGFYEKSAAGGGAVNAGLYRLCRQALPAGAQGAYSLEADVLPALARRHQLRGVTLRGRFIDIGVPEDYVRFCAEYG